MNNESVLNYLNTAVLIFDLNLKLSYINNAGEMLLDDSSRHLLGIPAGKLFAVPDNIFEKNLFQSRDYQETLVNRELILQLRDQPITVNFSATPLMDQQQMTNILVELLQVDNHLKISREKQLLAQQNTSKLLIRGLAHEIKNPLGGIRGAAQLLESELINHDFKEYTEIIIAESDRLQALMDRMLGPNKLPQKKSVNIHEILERVSQLIEIEATGELSIHRDYDPSIPDIMGDANQLIQAFLNIMLNAIQAIDKTGTVSIKSRINRQKTIGDHCYKLVVRVDVIDNGEGIHADMIQQIFYPMVTEKTGGSGLGLPIAQSLINQHKGLIECSSVPGNTIFSIYLPVENGDG